MMRNRLTSALQEIRDKGNYRTIRYLKPLSPTRVIYESKEYLNLCSNSYLSLHLNPEVVAAAKKAADEYGVGTCSSRSVSGSIDLYEVLEREIAAFKGYRRALIFPNGYMANLGIMSALTEEGDVIFSDELNHSSLIDSMKLSRSKKVVYKHRDVSDLERKLNKEKGKGERFVVTESVFSMDGDVAPIRDILELKERYSFQMILDDAHGTGVFGVNGTGAEELFGLSGSMDVQMATFGKSLGSFGAFVLADDVIIKFLVNRARTFMYTTGLPPPTLAAALAALRLISGSRSFRDELWENIDYMRGRLEDAGFDLKESEGPIIPIVVGEDRSALDMQGLLLEKGVFLQAIRPPTVPKGTSRLRFTVVRGFSRADMDYAITALVDAGKQMGIL
jgi:8-amino-7-oxononanoate synthase